MAARQPLPLPAAPANLLSAPHAASLQWFCAPPKADLAADGTLAVTTATKTDFWMRTHYGFTPDNGHFYNALLEGDFVLATTVQTRPNSRFDQAGLVVRLSPSCWLKTSVEHHPDRPSQLGVVVTNCGWSDWSTMDFPQGVTEVSLRVRREGSDYIVEASLPASAAGASSGVAAGGAPGGADGWTQLRMAHLIEDTSPSGAVGFGGGAAPAAGPTCAVSAGLYCASPLGPGFEARFAHLTAWAGRIEGPRED